MLFIYLLMLCHSSLVKTKHVSMNTIHIYINYLEGRPALADHDTRDRHNSYLVFQIVLPSTSLNHNRCVLFYQCGVQNKPLFPLLLK